MAHKCMGHYRIASQLTESLQGSDAKKEYLKEILFRLHSMYGEMDLTDFHAKLDKTDNWMITEGEATPAEVNRMYYNLESLVKDPEMDGRAKRWLRNWLDKFTPLPVERTRTVRRRREDPRTGVNNETLREMSFPEARENVQRHERNQFNMDNRINRQQLNDLVKKLNDDDDDKNNVVANVMRVLVSMGMVEFVPNNTERKQRLLERKFAWLNLK